MNNNNLRPNQLRAINTTIENNFNSGVHYHVTGSGKSWIAMNIIVEYNTLHPKDNIIWICEKKSILIEQFNKQNLKDREFYHIHKTFNILNYSENKLSKWYDSVNSGKFWSKPVLLIINRAYLTSSENYKKIKLHFNLLIHDECHTIVNKTTRDYYEYILSRQIIPKCIGFSATPNLSYDPYKNIITSYSIYDAFIDKVIVPPKIKWHSCDDMLEYPEIIHLIKIEIDNSKLPYRKIIVWCGMIDLCISMARLCKNYFENYLICIDTCKSSNQYGFSTYTDFDKLENNGLLFCAAKHREGSDIKNLDCCIFLDKVQNRCPKVFIQCIGRVLRIDKAKKKKFGLVIDVRAKSPLVICNNFNEYLNLPPDIHPWAYNYKLHINTDNKKLIKINQLMMIHNDTDMKTNDSDTSENNKNIMIESTTRDEIKKLFKRIVPDKDEYRERLEYELDMLESKNLIYYLMQAIKILDLTKNIPHVTRGSCGSSLVCYMLGISHIDPVKNKIKYARFLTEYRNNLPDIDLDFPHNLRDEVFLKIGLTWPGKVARISNHVYYHDKSALRAAIRNEGIHKFISKNDIHTELKKLSLEQRERIIKEKDRLEDTFRGYSLHCGGIVYYPEGIPEELLFKKSGASNNTASNGLIRQITMNKYDIAKEKNFKIDILSSRALSQCYECYKYKDIQFEEFTYDKATCDMLARGDNIGIILGESPLIRKVFIKIKPKNIHDLAVCLSIIRPAAMDARQSTDIEDYDNNIIFDDDAIDLIGNYLHIDDDKADNYRRAFAKGDTDKIREFKELLRERSYSADKQKMIMKKLSNLARYGFCKSHAFSYAQLIWKLAYMKAHKPKTFWKATLNNCVSSYKKWVHYYEASLVGIDVSNNVLKRDDVSIYAVNRRRKVETHTLTEQLRKYGYWIIKDKEFFPGCYLEIRYDDEYHFNGIIASYRMIKSYKGAKKKKLILFIGVGTRKYIEININDIKYFDNKKIGIKGIGYPNNESDRQCSIITTSKYRFY